MALFAGNKLYTREVTDPDDGQAYHVKLKKMDEGYREQRSDLLMKTREDTQRKIKKLPGAKRKRREQITEYNLGTVRLSDLSYSIKEWDFVDDDGDLVDINFKTLQGLSVEIADQIWDHIEELNPTVFNPADEDDEDDQDYEDADEGEAYAPVSVSADAFGEEGGPKESAN